MPPPGADTPRWVHRTADQMARYVEDDRAGHVYGRHVVAAVRAVRATASRPSADMRLAMASFVTKLTFREMCVVLREQRGWRQARDFFAWMKLQVCKPGLSRRPRRRGRGRRGGAGGARGEGLGRPAWGFGPALRVEGGCIIVMLGVEQWPKSLEDRKRRPLTESLIKLHGWETDGMVYS
ncbi:pentatricopeptide repeat-containing protein At5g27270-like [Setaria italica]|uniref:pentatricopeptide repeat-containing protein At5g27270-like n=1 Tax=Setaria italica TaxID=4555 RepID=UPI000BE5DA71|nr:pentatricopeptide repeat-containing protein At5g27270-like [Setaria italica]